MEETGGKKSEKWRKTEKNQGKHVENWWKTQVKWQENGEKLRKNDWKIEKHLGNHCGALRKLGETWWDN